MIEAVVFVVSLAVILAGVVALRRAQLRRIDRAELSEEYGNEVPPWDHGEEYREPPAPPLSKDVDHVNS